MLRSAALPVVVLLVTEPDEKIPGFVLENLLVLFGEDVLPVTGYALPEERGRVFLPSLPALREFIEAGRVHAPPHYLFARPGPEELEQTPEFIFGSLEENLVAHFGIIVPEQDRAVLDGPAHPLTPLRGHLLERVPREHTLAGLSLGVLAVGFTFHRRPGVLFAGLAEVPGVVHRGDRRVPAVADDVDDSGLGVDLGYLLHGLRGEQRRLVAHHPLAGLGELSYEEVVDGHAGEVVQVLVRVVVPAPDRPLYPEPQVLRVQHRVVERAGRPPGVHPLYGLSSPTSAEKPPLALAEDLRVGVEDPHQPGGPGFLLTDDEEHRRAPLPSPQLPPQRGDLRVLDRYLPPGSLAGFRPQGTGRRLQRRLCPSQHLISLAATEDRHVKSPRRNARCLLSTAGAAEYGLPLQVIRQRFSPVAKLEAPQRGQYPIGRARRRQGILRARDGDDFDLDPGQPEYLLRELVPGAGPGVGQVVEAVAPTLRDPGDAFGQVAGVGRRDELVVLDLEHIPLSGHAQHGTHEVMPPSVDAGGTDDVPASCQVLHVLLAGQFGAAVGADRGRQVEGLVGPITLPVEDVVGAHVQQLASLPLANLGQVARPQGVDRIRQIRLRLAPVHVRKRSRVDNELRRVILHSPLYGFRIGYVELFPGERHRLVASPRQYLGQLQPELALRAGYENLHPSVKPSASLHPDRLGAYHRVLPARPHTARRSSPARSPFSASRAGPAPRSGVSVAAPDLPRPPARRPIRSFRASRTQSSPQGRWRRRAPRLRRPRRSHRGRSRTSARARPGRLSPT